MALLKDPAIKFGILGGLANLVTFFILYSLGAEIFIGIWRYLPWFGMFTLAFVACVQIIKSEGYLLFPRAMSIILVVIVISEFTAVLTEFVIRNVVDPGLTEQIREIRLINTEEAAEWFDENLGYSEGDMQEVMEQVENADFNFYLKDALLKFLQILCIDFIFALILASIVKKQPNPT